MFFEFFLCPLFGFSLTLCNLYHEIAKDKDLFGKICVLLRFDLKTSMNLLGQKTRGFLHLAMTSSPEVTGLSGNLKWINAAKWNGNRQGSGFKCHRRTTELIH